MTASTHTPLHILEAILLSAPEPVREDRLMRVFEPPLEREALRTLLVNLAAAWADRGVALQESAGGWRFVTRPDYQIYLDRLRAERPPRLSRALLETLAVIAYRQPVTRGDIEHIRGVAVAAQIVRTLEARGWIDVVGHREVPGRPALYATTQRFLDDLGLRSLSELPPLNEIRAQPEISNESAAS